jgi:hypothetical protein
MNQKKYIKDIIYNNININNNNNSNKSKINKINYYNEIKNNLTDNIKDNILGGSVHTYNIKPFQKIKKINFQPLENKSSENDRINYHTNIAIKKDNNMLRQDYFLSKIGIHKDKGTNKSINLGNNQINKGNNKFKKYMNKLLDEGNSFILLFVKILLFLIG